MIAQDDRLQALRARGQRVTPQRLMIAAAVRDLDRHAICRADLHRRRRPDAGAFAADGLRDPGAVRGDRPCPPGRHGGRHRRLRPASTSTTTWSAASGVIADVDGAVDHAVLLGGPGRGVRPTRPRSSSAACAPPAMWRPPPSARGAASAVQDRVREAGGQRPAPPRRRPGWSPRRARRRRRRPPAAPSPAGGAPGRRAARASRPSQEAAPGPQSRSRGTTPSTPWSPPPCTARRRSSRRPRGRARARPPSARSVTASSDPRPCSSVTSVRVITSTRGVRSRRSTR